MRKNIEEKATMRNGYWFKSTKEFMREVNVKYFDLKTIKKEKLKDKIMEWDSKKWQQEIAGKSRVSVYKIWKTKMI